MPEDQTALVVRHLLRHHAMRVGELQALGVTPGTIKRLRASGLLRSFVHGVVGLTNAPDRRAQRQAVALAAHRGAFLSHQTAARLHGLDVPDGLVHVTAPLSTRAKGRDLGVSVHRTDYLPPVDRGRVAGWALTSRTRTLCDLAATLTTQGDYRELVEEAVVARWVGVDELLACHVDLSERGRPGSQLRNAIFDEVFGTEPWVAESELERAFRRLAEREGIAGIEYQYRPPWFDGVAGIVDAAIPEFRLIIELDGRRWHSTSERFENDRARDRAAAEHGWRVLRFTWTDVKRRPELVTASVRAAISLH